MERKKNGKNEKKDKLEPDATPVQAALPASKKRVTIADIARLADVSTATVSITLSDRRDIVIPESTRDHVKRCAEAAGYLPSRLGEGFLRGHSRLIGILVLADSYVPFLDCIAGIQKELAVADYVPIVLSSDWLNGYDQNGSAAGAERLGKLPALRRLLEYQVEGVLYFSLDMTYTADCVRELSRVKIPAVVLGGEYPQSGVVDTVGGDNKAIGRMAANYLLSSGCTSFAVGMPALSHPIDQAVRASFAARLGSAGRDCVDFTVDAENPGNLAAALSRLVRPPAGLFCANGKIAALAMRAALALGWTKPGDFEVIGMCSRGISDLNAMPMTTIDRNSFAAGEVAARLLIQRIESKRRGGRRRRILIRPSLHARSPSISDVSWRGHSSLPA